MALSASCYVALRRATKGIEPQLSGHYREPQDPWQGTESWVQLLQGPSQILGHGVQLLGTVLPVSVGVALSQQVL